MGSSPGIGSAPGTRSAPGTGSASGIDPASGIGSVHRGGAARSGRIRWGLGIALVLAAATPVAPSWGGLVLPTAQPLRAQGVRGTVVHTGFYARMRPLAQDTLARDEVSDLGGGEFEWQGQPVYCQAAECVRFRAGEVASTVSGSVDASFTAWGLGVRGLSSTVSFRVRERTGGELLWPRTDDRFDLFLGYLQWSGAATRFRLGRQRVLGGLGRSAFDGASAMWQFADGWAVEGYAGRSLARALAEPRNDALRPLESFLPDRDAWLFGASARARFSPDVDVALRYQREIWSHRTGLLSERASVDVRAYLLDRVRLEAAADWDFAFVRPGKAHLSLRLPWAEGRWSASATVRRYLPYFELWTVWGFFSPVPYHEAQLQLAWSPSTATRVWLAGAWREYGATSTVQVLAPLESTGRRVTAGFTWSAAERLAFQGEYRLEGNAGAFFSGGDLSAAVEVSERVRVSLGATAFQQFQEFRIGEGTALGATLSLDMELPSNLSLSGGASLLRLSREAAQTQPDWNQLRGFWSLRVPMGSDPGLRREVVR